MLHQNEKWTENQLQYLKDNYPSTQNAQKIPRLRLLAETLGKSVPAVISKASELNLLFDERDTDETTDQYEVDGGVLDMISREEDDDDEMYYDNMVSIFPSFQYIFPSKELQKKTFLVSPHSEDHLEIPLLMIKQKLFSSDFSQYKRFVLYENMHESLCLVGFNIHYDSIIYDNFDDVYVHSVNGVYFVGLEFLPIFDECIIDRMYISFAQHKSSYIFIGFDERGSRLLIVECIEAFDHRLDIYEYYEQKCDRDLDIWKILIEDNTIRIGAMDNFIEVNRKK